MLSPGKLLLLSLPLAVGLGCTNQQSVPGLSMTIEPEDIHSHISFLADDALRGRATGSPEEASAANYIADHFKTFGLHPAGDDSTFFQMFTVHMSARPNPHRTDSGSVSKDGDERIARNVAGIIEGTSDPDRYIVVGAHYDHLGIGEFGSLSQREEHEIHNGADDNASGTAGVLELAHYFSRHLPQKSLLFVAFSGEEMGLLGSRHFIEHSPVPIDQIEAMINMDMIGRMAQNKLLVFGTGSSAEWDRIVRNANSGSLEIQTVPDGTGGSDHTSFYNRQIPVLHYFTDTHADYHRPSDDTEQINFEGEDRILEHARRVIEQLVAMPRGQLAFTESPNSRGRDVTISGITLGVTPDYGFDGNGLRITGTSPGEPAERAGLRSGDVIVRLNGKKLRDIYEYMEVLNELQQGQSSTVTVVRDGQEITFDLQL